MEEDIHYSTVEFKNSASAPKKNKEEDSIYSQVAAKQIFPSAPPYQEEPVYSEIKTGKQKRKKENAPTKKNPEADFDPISKDTTQTAVVTAEVQGSGSRFRLLLVCLGIICFLLCVAIIVIIIYFTMETNKQKQNLSDLEAKNEQLTLEKRDLQIQTEDLRMNMTKLENQNQDLKINRTKLENQTEDLRMNMANLENQTKDLRRNMENLENQTEQLTADKMFFENQTKEMTVNMTILQMQIEQLRNNSDKLNRMKAAIIKYTNFPVDFFCPDGVCQMCPKDWIQFNESCYFFYNLNSPSNTWDQSRQICQSKKSDLVVISSQEEQTFIKSRIEYYIDTWHGYWIGLRRINNNWIWVDDSQDTLGYWNNPGSSDNFTLIRKNLTENQSWFRNQISSLHRFICEIKAFIF